MYRYGKLPYDQLRKVLAKLSRKDSSVILGPAIGEDAALVDLGERVLVVHADPITGAEKDIGWLSVHVAANDIATRGVKPRWLLSVILLPERSDEKLLNEIVDQIRSAANEIDASIVGGHTEITPGLDRPIIITTAIGEGKREEILTTAGAKPGDKIVLTKGAGIEGTAILASELYDKMIGKIEKDVLERAKLFIREISVVRDAMIAVKVGGVHAMHDPTEGGVLGGLQEMAMASNLGIYVEEEKIPVRRETEIICRTLGVDYLKLISSGTLLIAVDPSKARDLVSELRREGIDSSIIGQFKDDKERVILRKNGDKVDLNIPVVDELWTILSIS
ncbi:MAG: AIR synthase family protein [Candidatus Methanodesulfokora sp.]|jgi:hydrogenase maturation factor